MGAQSTRPAPRKLSVGLRCWLECDGHVLLGRGRATLLDGIGKFHSISAAARAMGMSYRRAWLLVKSMNDAAGEAIVETAIGGASGGGAVVTSRGREVLDAFRRLDSALQNTAEDSLPRLGKRHKRLSRPQTVSPEQPRRPTGKSRRKRD